MSNPSTLAVKNPGNPKTVSLPFLTMSASRTAMIGYFVQPITVTKMTWVPDTTGTALSATLKVTSGPIGTQVDVCAATALGITTAAVDLPITGNNVLAAGSVLMAVLAWTSHTASSPGILVVEYYNHDV